MVLFLVLDVIHQPILVSSGMRECRVSILPVGKIWENVVPLYPIGRSAFHLFDEIGQRYRRMQARKNVQVIRSPIYLVQNGFLLENDAPDISKQSFSAVLNQYRRSLFGGENDVVADLRVR